MQAAQNGHEACLKLLISAGADVSLKTHDGSDALYFAVEKSHLDCVGLIVNTGSVESRSSLGAPC